MILSPPPLVLLPYEPMKENLAAASPVGGVHITQEVRWTPQKKDPLEVNRRIEKEVGGRVDNIPELGFKPYFFYKIVGNHP